MSAEEFANFVGLSHNKINAAQLLNFLSSIWRTQWKWEFGRDVYDQWPETSQKANMQK